MPIAILRDLVVTRVDLVDLGENQAADIVLFKRRAPAAAREGKTMLTTEISLAEVPEALRAPVEALRKRAADADTAEELARKAEDRAVAAEKELEKLRAANPESVDVEKARLAALPEDIRKRLEASEAQIAALKDEKETGEFIAKARALPLAATTAESFGPLLRRIAKGLSTAEDADEVARLVKAMGEQIEAGALFGERGASGGQGQADAYAEARAIAKAKVEAGQFASIEKALSAVWKEKPERWKRYRAEEGQR